MIERKRRKLFSDPITAVGRRKLFSAPEDQRLTTFKCADCGFELETSATTTNMICPKCGGIRFYYTTNPPAECQTNCSTDGKKRISLFSKDTREEEFQKSFSEPSNNFELKLKRYSGKTILAESCEKIFGVPAEELLEKRFAELDGENLNIAPNAYIKSKLFSKLIVSVTKIMDLDPDLTSGEIINKKRAIEGLEATGALCPKSIIMIKKAHGFDPLTSLNNNNSTTWAEDSGILNDLSAEFGGESLDYPMFKKTIEDRYPDAPSEILDILKNRGIIKIMGDRVNIL